MEDNSAIPEALPSGHDGVDNLAVIALGPGQMEKCQDGLIEWVERKIAAIRAEEDDLRTSFEIAKKQKWGSAALYRAAGKAKARAEYYEKIKAAIQTGYCIVPNFPVDLIAVRVSRHNPRAEETTVIGDAITAKAETLPAGEGRFVDDRQYHTSRNEAYTGYDGKPQTRQIFKPTRFDDNIDFPFVIAKPEVLSALARATAERIFDEIGVLPGRAAPKGDPILVGRIIDPTRGSRWQKHVTSFLIAWYVDTRDL